MVLRKGKKRKNSTSEEVEKIDENVVRKEENDQTNEIEEEMEEKPEDIEEDFVDPERKQHKSGVVYFSAIPTGFNVDKITMEMNRYSKGCVGRVYLVPTKSSEKLKNGSARESDDRKTKKRHLTYKEGWIEFTRKSVAKHLARSLNGMPVQVRTKHPASGLLWLCKYLPGFKWIHLMEQLDYERKVNMQRMKMEIARAKRVAEHFSEQVEKGKNLKKLEEKVLKKGGLWEKHHREIEQRQPIGKPATKKSKKGKPVDEDELMKMIYAE
ncbi:unnamed protein product, partial [Mesorhabditis belari]|uniref:Activator of basal transcription 1 n=1 Tax=Mesorhabditis belari TaxID=2138241 RepID=A0AAF3F264_9BILA